MTEIKDNREVMRNRIPNEVCRVCGSRDVHVDHYGQPTVKCITYLRTVGNEARAEATKLKAALAAAEECVGHYADELKWRLCGGGHRIAKHHYQGHSAYKQNGYDHAVKAQAEIKRLKGE